MKGLIIMTNFKRDPNGKILPAFHEGNDELRECIKRNQEYSKTDVRHNGPNEKRDALDIILEGSNEKREAGLKYCDPDK